MNLILTIDGRGNNRIICPKGKEFRITEIDGKVYGRTKRELECKNLPHLINCILYNESHISLLKLYNMD